MQTGHRETCDICSFWWSSTDRMREKLESAQRPALSITRYFRTTSKAAVQVLAGALPIDLQVEKEHLLAQVPSLNRDIGYCPIHFRADEVQRKVVKFRVYLRELQPLTV